MIETNTPPGDGTPKTAVGTTDRTIVLKHVVVIMSRVFGVPASEIGELTTPEHIERWDSLSMLTVLIGIERRFGVIVLNECLQRVANVGDLVDVVYANLTRD